MLYIIASPIGNLEDMTMRAIRILNEVDLVIAEDSRETKKLLNHYDIDKPIRSVHQHSTQAAIDELLTTIQNGGTMAYLTDAGTPGISDPGGMLVERARMKDIRVVPIPGASALTCLLSVAGIPLDEFWFVGFMPKKQGRKSLLTEIGAIEAPVVIFEAAPRILKTLKELKEVRPNGKIIVGRELTKAFEEIVSVGLDQAIEKWTKEKPRGEFVLVVS